MKKFLLLLIPLIFSMLPAAADDSKPPCVTDAKCHSVQELERTMDAKIRVGFKDAVIFSAEADPVYLGCLCDPESRDSIFNPHGLFGSRWSPISVWNHLSEYGDAKNPFSAMNPEATDPPYIIKNGTVIARLTNNRSYHYFMDPYLLKYVMILTPQKPVQQ